MTPGYATKPGKSLKVNRRKSQLIQYGLGSTEAKALLDDLSKKYPGPTRSVKQVREMLDKLLGDRTLTDELHKIRDEE